MKTSVAESMSRNMGKPVPLWKSAYWLAYAATFGLSVGLVHLRVALRRALRNSHEARWWRGQWASSCFC
jgi:hypothetical protein